MAIVGNLLGSFSSVKYDSALTVSGQNFTYTVPAGKYLDCGLVYVFSSFSFGNNETMQIDGRGVTPNASAQWQYVNFKLGAGKVISASGTGDGSSQISGVLFTNS